MPPVIDLQPALLDLILYAGDGISIRLNCTNGAGAPIDITGMVRAQIRVDRLTDTDPVVDFAVETIDAYLGIVTLTLTGEQTTDLIEHDSVRDAKFTGVWDVEWTPDGSEPRTLCQGSAECVADVTR